MMNPAKEKKELEHFLDPAGEWRRIFAEAWGTFLLVAVAAGGEMVFRSGGDIPHAFIMIAPGLMVMSIIYFMGSVSGAHVNPAVTFAFALRRNFPWYKVPGYWAAQAAGGFAAVLLLRALLGPSGDLGATMPGENIGDIQTLIMEILLSAGLVNVILGTASGARNIGHNGAIAVGGYIALAGLWASPVSGASMNPIRSLAPDVLRGDLQMTWVYIAGPLAGAVIGVIFEWILKGKPTKEGTMTAQGEN